VDLAIVGDLLITAPLLYFLARRSEGVSYRVILRWMATGIFFAGMIINAQNSSVLKFVQTWIYPLVEVLVIALICVKFYNAGKKSREMETVGADFLSYSRSMVSLVAGSEKLGDMLGTEIAVFYYTLLGKPATDHAGCYSSFRKNGIMLILGVFLALMLVETAAMHLLFSLWNSTAAWVMTGLSLYTCLQLFAHMRALKARPILVLENGIMIRHGLAGDAFIDLNNLENIEIVRNDKKGNGSVKIALFGVLESSNIRLDLMRPVTVTRFFGLKTKASVVYLYVDDPERLIASAKSKKLSD
jgi:hypothetical protein